MIKYSQKRIKQARPKLTSDAMPTAKNDSREANEIRLWLQLLGAYGRIYNDLNRVLADQNGLSIAKFDLLAQLYRYPDGLSMGELSDNLKVSSGNISGLITRLRKDGLVQRKMSADDRRSFTASLTLEGHNRFEGAMKVHQKEISKKLQFATTEEIDNVTESLKIIADRLAQSHDQ